MNRRLVHLLCSLSLAGQLMPASLAATQPELNFKVYSPESSTQAPADPGLLTPKTDDSVDKPAQTEDKHSSDSMWSTDTAPTSGAGDVTTPAATPAADSAAAEPAKPATETASTPATEEAADKSTETAAASDAPKSQKVLKGYIRVVPSGTKVPIIMDTAVDSDTSQEGDEFSARTSEDLNIDGTTVVPAGSIIKGRIAQLNAPKNMGRSGSVALKFDTVTTPDNRQIPLVANLVARGGVVHARRGLKDIAIDSTAVAVPALLGTGIGLLAGSSKSGTSGKSHLGKGTGAVIGAGVGLAVGVAILCIKKGKKVDVRPGDELKIELAEDLRMPM